MKLFELSMNEENLNEVLTEDLETGGVQEGNNGTENIPEEGREPAGAGADLQFLTMQELHAQMRIDFEDEDLVVAMYGKAAEDATISATGRTIEELKEMGGGEVPVRLKVAALMLAANWHRNREPVASIAQNVVPYAYDVLMKPFRKLTEREV